MKKLFCAILVLSLLFTFTACGGAKKVAGGADIAYYADIGSFPESEIKIDDGVPAEDSDNYFFSQDGDNKCFSDGSFNYYYADKGDGEKVTAIAAFSAVFGFEIGAVSIQISDLLEKQEIKYSERSPKENELFFLPASGNFSVIECRDLSRNLIFVFEDNFLCAAFME